MASLLNQYSLIFKQHLIKHTSSLKKPVPDVLDWRSILGNDLYRVWQSRQVQVPIYYWYTSLATDAECRECFRPFARQKPLPLSTVGKQAYIRLCTTYEAFHHPSKFFSRICRLTPISNDNSSSSTATYRFVVTYTSPVVYNRQNYCHIQTRRKRR